MSISKSDLEESLRQVKQGLAQLRHPQEATALSELLTTLGPPPPEIQADWDQQLSTLIQQFEQSAGRTIGELYASDFLVDADNRLSFSPSFWASLANTPAPSIFSTPSRVAEASSQFTQTNDAPTAVSRSNGHRSTADAKAMNRLKAFAKKHRWATPLTVLVSAAIMIGLAFYGLATSESEDPLAQRAITPANTNTESIFSPETKPSRQQDAAPENSSSQAEPAALSYLDPTEDTTASETTSSATAAAQPDPDRSTMGLDSFGKADWVSASDLSSMDDDELAPADDLEQSDAPDLPTTTDSITVAVQDTNTLELPALPTSATSDKEPASVVLFDQSTTATELFFPSDVGLMLRGPKQQGDATVWEVTDEKDDAAIAMLTSFSGNTNEQVAATDSLDVGLSFHWLSLAATRPKAKQLSAGLLKLTLLDGQQRSLFLRPRLSAAPWPVDFSEPDVKVAWPITHAPPAGSAELQLEFEVPKTVTQSWVQAHDVKQWRRSQSLIEFKLQSDPSIVIRSRIDLRTGNRIQLRMRHAAQMDPSFPWMSVSTSRIETASTDLAQRLTVANAQLAELKSAYARASQTGKRVLANRRDTIETGIANLEALHKRLVKYDQLISTIDKTAALSVQLSVTWPESTGVASQVIFHMPASEEASAE